MVTKISEIDLCAAKNYLRIDDDFLDDDELIGTIILASKSYISKHTNRPIGYLDSSEEFTIAALMVIADLYEIRQASLIGYTNIAVNNMLGFILSMDRDLS